MSHRTLLRDAILDACEAFHRGEGENTIATINRALEIHDDAMEQLAREVDLSDAKAERAGRSIVRAFGEGI